MYIFPLEPSSVNTYYVNTRYVYHFLRESKDRLDANAIALVVLIFADRVLVHKLGAACSMVALPRFFVSKRRFTPGSKAFVTEKIKLIIVSPLPEVCLVPLRPEIR